MTILTDLSSKLKLEPSEPKKIFHNILSDCHNFDMINSLLNAFSLKKIKVSLPSLKNIYHYEK